VQPPQLPLSSLHSKLDPDSVEVKAKLAEVELVLGAGPLVIEVSGGVVSGGGGVGVGSGVGVGAGLYSWRWLNRKRLTRYPELTAVPRVLLWWLARKRVPPLQAKAAVGPSAMIRKIAAAEVRSVARGRLVR
jgi:hypothetical protein